LKLFLNFCDYLAKPPHLPNSFKALNALLFVLQARSQCTSTCKWLLINLQNTMEFACQVLNRDVWANKVVRELLKENFILWQVGV